MTTDYTITSGGYRVERQGSFLTLTAPDGREAVLHRHTAQAYYATIAAGSTIADAVEAALARKGTL